MKGDVIIASIVIFGCIMEVESQCPGASGDAMCQAKAGVSSFCVPGTWRCQGLPIACGCDFSVVAVSTKAPISSTTSLPESTAAVSPTIVASSTRVSRVSRPATLPPTSTTSIPASTSPITTSTTVVPISVAAVSSVCGSTSSRPLFIWAEWPHLPTSADEAAYFAKMLSFINGNCGNFRITRLVMRVMNPSDIWTVGTSSLFYTAFLSKLPANVELFVYPYLLTSASQALWGFRPLEGVFKFASDWNKIPGVRISGITLDLEEKNGFGSELSSVTQYKATYGIGKFGLAIGYDAIGSAVSYPYVDEFFIELYDFYVNDARTLTLVQAASVPSPSAFLAVLTRDVLGPYVAKYTDPRFNFMWSVQAKSSTNCFFPLGSGCGSSNDFGSGWSAQAFGQFLADLTTQYPVFAGRSHGLFQFSFIPNAWA